MDKHVFVIIVESPMPDSNTNWQEWAVTKDDKNSVGKSLLNLCKTFGLDKIKSSHNINDENFSVKHKLGDCFKNWIKGDCSKVLIYKDGRVDIGISRELLK